MATQLRKAPASARATAAGTRVRNLSERAANRSRLRPPVTSHLIFVPGPPGCVQEMPTEASSSASKETPPAGMSQMTSGPASALPPQLMTRIS